MWHISTKLLQMSLYYQGSIVPRFYSPKLSLLESLVIPFCIYLVTFLTTSATPLSCTGNHPGKKIFLAERGFDPRTSGLWAQHASTAPLCYTHGVNKYVVFHWPSKIWCNRLQIQHKHKSTYLKTEHLSPTLFSCSSLLEVCYETCWNAGVGSNPDKYKRNAFLSPKLTHVRGLVAQWITRLTTDQKIPGSNPGKLESPILRGIWCRKIKVHIILSQ